MQDSLSVGMTLEIRFFVNKILCKIPSILYLGVDILLFASSEMLISNGAVLFKLINMLLDVLRHMCGAISAFMLLQRLINRFIPLFVSTVFSMLMCKTKAMRFLVGSK